MKKLTIAVAGASGFVGSEVLKRLAARDDIQIIALSRSGKAPESLPSTSSSRLKWLKCDLYSLLDIEKALEGVDSAFYLVHSMSPTASLDQGEFQDYDLILADNFARAAKSLGLGQIIYLGGILPAKRDLSIHLRSRFEVEQTLRTYGVPVTALRARMIVGSDGSSFNIMVRLVKRLPIIFCPPWANTQTQPIDIENVTECLVHCLNNKQLLGKSFDIGGPDILTYKMLLKETSLVLGKVRLFINIPFLNLSLSKYLVSLITGAPSDLVYPLVSSLKHTVLVHQDQELTIHKKPRFSFHSSLVEALGKSADHKIEDERIDTIPHAFKFSKEIDDKKK